VEVIKRLLEISESEGIPRERISYEEERTSQGFVIDQFFSYSGGIGIHGGKQQTGRYK